MSSRNIKHMEAIWEVKELLGDKVLVMDREFSYESLLEELVEADIRFVIRLNDGVNPNIVNEAGDKVSLVVGEGEEEHYRGVYYKGKVAVNLAGRWSKKTKKSFWVISSMGICPTEALMIYSTRMKIEECFRNLKSLLNLDRIMNKKQENMEKMMALTLLAYSIGLLLGEEIRRRLYTAGKRKLYSGLFILLKRNDNLATHTWKDIMGAVLSLFRRLVFGYVRTHF